MFTPTSPPVVCRYSPHLSTSSVGNGPAPTRVVYALTIPITRSMRVGPTPVPVQAPPAVGLRAGDERVGAVVDVQVGGLAALHEHDLLAIQRIEFSSSVVSTTIGRSRSA